MNATGYALLLAFFALVAVSIAVGVLNVSAFVVQIMRALGT